MIYEPIVVCHDFDNSILILEVHRSLARNFIRGGGPLGGPLGGLVGRAVQAWFTGILGKCSG